MRSDSRAMRCVAIVCLIGLAPAVAMAYIDPGNGAYMVQVLFTLAGAAIFYIRHPMQSVKTAWRWLVRRHGAGGGDAEAAEGAGIESEEIGIHGKSTDAMNEST